MFRRVLLHCFLTYVLMHPGGSVCYVCGCKSYYSVAPHELQRTSYSTSMQPPFCRSGTAATPRKPFHSNLVWHSPRVTMGLLLFSHGW
ncbi:hypothetical protein F5Y12DRAFT_106608 [Xylaria sp. FL1777]|nr:hypothetical protein F5Y12DRAFT_106608 [Xylaria sp. FL1777]